MSDVFESIMRGATEALDYAEGRADENQFRAHVPEQVDVKAIRKRLDMSQSVFAAAFGFSIDAVKKWERGARRPEGPARAYLEVISKRPDAVFQALAGDQEPPRCRANG